MKEYTPDTIDDVRMVLRGLDHRMKVEIEPAIPLAAKTAADLRALPSWPDGLALDIHIDLDPRFSVVRVERASQSTHV